MTVFLIVLIIFLIVQADSKITKTAQAKEYFRKTKSNSKLQYDTACETIKQMGEAYREYLSTITILEYFNVDNEQTIYNIINENNFYTKEYRWLIATIKATNISIDNNCMKIIYGERIWEKLPEKYSKDFLEYWINKYNLFDLDKEKIKHQIKKMIQLKQQILYDNEKCNSYMAYTNRKALDYVAHKFNLPTNEEIKKLYYNEYQDLQDLCFQFTCRHSHTKGKEYNHIPLTMICENPTVEQKKIQYKKMTDSEKLSKKIREEAEIRKKYNLD